MKKIIVLLILIVEIFASNCQNKLFTMKVSYPIPLNSVLSNLSEQCNLSIVYDDILSKEKIKNEFINYINVKNVSLNKLLNILSENSQMFISLQNNKLHISYNKTQIFKINYVANSINGDSSISSDNSSLSSNYKFNFWDNVKDNVIQILTNIDKNNVNTPIINKIAGLVTVTGNKLQLKELKKYFDKLNKSLQKEVLIDVKIYSVELSQSKATGINWQNLQISLDSGNKLLRGTYIGGAESVFKSATFNMKAFLNFLAQYGNVNSISNPKIVALNNQKAVVNIGDYIYYKKVSEIVVINNTPQTKYDIDKQFVGVLLDITPQVSDDNYVILNINPKLSSFRDLSQLKNTNRDMPPDIKTNNIMTTVRLKNNDTLVLGGLITSDKSLNNNGVPILSEIPLIKYFFSHKEKISNRKEIVFVITPHIINLSKKSKLSNYGYRKLPSLEELNVK